MKQLMLRSIALSALVASAAIAQPMLLGAGPTAIKLVSNVPSQPSEVFKDASELAFEVATTEFDRTPYRVAETFVGTITVPIGARVGLAGDAAGTMPFSIDNFLFFEIGEHRFLIGFTEPVFYQGQLIEQIGPAAFTFEPGSIDLTPYFDLGEPTSIRVLALDYGAVGHVSDLFLVVGADVAATRELELIFVGADPPYEEIGEVALLYPFRVMLRYDEPPEDAPTMVRVVYPATGETLVLEVAPTGDPSTFISEPAVPTS